MAGRAAIKRNPRWAAVAPALVILSTFRVRMARYTSACSGIHAARLLNDRDRVCWLALSPLGSTNVTTAAALYGSVDIALSKASAAGRILVRRAPASGHGALARLKTSVARVSGAGAAWGGIVDHRRLDREGRAVLLAPRKPSQEMGPWPSPLGPGLIWLSPLLRYGAYDQSQVTMAMLPSRRRVPARSTIHSAWAG